MYKQFFAGMDLVALPLFALAIFLSLFVLLVLRTLFIQSRREIDSRALLPLQDDSAVSVNEVKL